MRIAKIISLLTILQLLLLMRCKNPSVSDSSHPLFFADVDGDSKLDSLQLVQDSGFINVYRLNASKRIKIIGIAPLIDEKYRTTIPQVEVAHLEGNYVQTNKASLRVLFRNTDLTPDYVFVDLAYKNEWIMASIGRMATQDTLHIDKIHIGEPVKKICNEKLNCSLLELWNTRKVN